MKYLITGGTGLVGSRLIKELLDTGHTDIRVLTTQNDPKSHFPVKFYKWNPRTGEIDFSAFEAVDCVIHLAGAGVADARWSKARKELILSSRAEGTKLIVKTLKTIKESGQDIKLISTSAIGIYGNKNDEILTTNSKISDDFLANVCYAWEQEALKAKDYGIETKIIRTGIVLSSKGGALAKMLPPFKMGVAGILGDGKQFMSWIHIKDLVAMYIFLSKKKTKQDIYNGVSPSPISNYGFTKSLGSVLSRPTLFPLPKFMLRTIFGEMSQILTDSQRVLEEDIINEGFIFDFKYLSNALEDLLSNDIKSEVVFERYQVVDKDIEGVFDFFSDEKNLERITPAYLNFKVLNKSTPEIEEGTIINYKLKLHGLPMKWKSRITEFEKGSHFVDEQLSGPYSKWHHTHQFIRAKEQTVIKDTVVYKLPLGPLGSIFAGPFVNKDVIGIFNYRNEVIRKSL